MKKQKRIEDLKGIEFSDAIEALMKREVSRINKELRAQHPPKVDAEPHDLVSEMQRTVKTIEAQYVDGVPEWVRLIAQRTLHALKKAGF